MDVNSWLEEILPKYDRLTDSVTSIARSLLEENNIEYLSITGRTKEKKNINEKITRKGYNNPQKQLTDISGIRIILFIESDTIKVSNIIKSSFSIDDENSINKDESLSSNEVGYRSVHYVCDLGPQRENLPEFAGLKGLKFEFQIRTVLQHAWAELAHDRSYKFRSALPKEIQRRLYLHAGLLEIADKGFSEIANEIDLYSKKISEQYESGNLDIEINSISLTEFAESWAKENKYPLKQMSQSTNFTELIRELRGFAINKIGDIRDIIPHKYAEEANKLQIKSNIFGLIRDWMIIKDIDKLKKEIKTNWVISDPDFEFPEQELYKKLSSPENYKKIIEYALREHVSDDEDEGDS
ncbi:GTP pyrophosphokinase [Ensifer sp. ENS01]|uniref:GTP pyrophosphokinase n=1 Tax=Ensifer sp. ENS01 TaxID=2769293 RepID=UPI000DD69E8F|nr:GTP pyrophosphokinase [Ensifer sp. ENS01]MBD9495296.1 GTP pyrophosphokinase [Ensifer sp. ENS01]